MQLNNDHEEQQDQEHKEEFEDCHKIKYRRVTRSLSVTSISLQLLVPGMRCTLSKARLRPQAGDRAKSCTFPLAEHETWLSVSRCDPLKIA